MKPIVGILLAAGSSRRFGADKLSQFLPGGEGVAVQSCRNLLAGTDKVLAVVRSGSERLAEQLQAEGAETLVCADAEQGMSASLVCGVRACSDAAGWVIALADMPWIAPATIRQVAESLRLGTLIVAPYWQGKRGHPVGFAHILGPELAVLCGDEGAKSVIQAHYGQVQKLYIEDSGVLRDIDKPEDLLAFNEFIKSS